MIALHRSARALTTISIATTCFTSCGPDKPTATGGMGGAEVTSSVSSSSSSSMAGPGSGSGGALPDTFTVKGIVTDGSNPIAGALVLQGGSTPAFETGADGTFSIEMTNAIPGTPTIVAAKIGYRSNGVEFFDAPNENIEIVLHAVSPPDNLTTYSYGPPGVGDAAIDNSTAVCGHCHTTFVAQFQTSAHAKSARDPLVQDLYAGTANADSAACTEKGGIFRNGRVPGSVMDTKQKCYVGGGVLEDLNGCGGPNDLSCDDPALEIAKQPTAFGHCADCHAAGIPGPTGGRNLLDATGVAFDNGNHCDVCHKVSDIDLTKPPGVAGRLIIQRPRETVTGEPGSKLRQVMYGPLLDVPNEFMGGSYQPKFSQAVFCAGCHEQKQEALMPGTTLDAKFANGLPTHSTYSEWSDSAWADAGTQCQHCHMPPNQDLVNTIDTAVPEKSSIIYGFPRSPEQIRSHIFRGPLAGPSRLIDTALGMWLEAKIDNADLNVRVKVSNQGAGHALPTGEPMRSLLLVVRATACGQNLSLKNGLSLDDVGGALASGIVDQDVTIVGKAWTWNAGALRAKAGQVLRVFRNTGQFIDYPGIGYFANPALSAADKGIPERLPIGEAHIVSVTNGVLTVDQDVLTQSGDVVWLGEDAPPDFNDGSASLALAGMAGHAFARVLVDTMGERLVPHYKAVGMVRDNRLLPLEPVTTTHVFAVPAGCSNVSVRATALYRPVPVHIGRVRGFDTRDWVAAIRNEIVTIP